MKALFALAQGAPIDVFRPVAAACEAADVEGLRVELGRVGWAGKLGRVVQAIMGEAEARQLMRELTMSQPEVGVGFDPGAVSALVLARDQKVSRTPVVAVVPELAPRRAWPTAADRYAVVDDEAAVALTDHGVDGARVIVVGPMTSSLRVEAGKETKGAAKAAFKLPTDVAVALVDCRGLSVETLGQVILQLALFERNIFTLFDAADSADAAALVRKQVPGLGMRGKLFGEHVDAPRMWRAADFVIARPRARAIHAALAAGAGFVSLMPEGEAENAEADAIVERNLGTIAGSSIVLSASIDQLVKDAGARAAVVKGAERRRADGAGLAGELIAAIAADRDAVLAETFAASEQAAAAAAAADAAAAEREARRDAKASGIEDLGGDDESFEDLADGTSPPRASTPPPPDLERRRAELAAAESRAKKELDESRAAAEQWEQRAVLARAKGDHKLENDARREADRKRARVTAAIQELTRLAAERSRIGGAAGNAPRASVDDQLSSLKKKAAASVEDELAALKRRMEREKKK